MSVSLRSPSSGTVRIHPWRSIAVNTSHLSRCWPRMAEWKVSLSPVSSLSQSFGYSRLPHPCTDTPAVEQSSFVFSNCQLFSHQTDKRSDFELHRRCKIKTGQSKNRIALDCIQYRILDWWLKCCHNPPWVQLSTRVSGNVIHIRRRSNSIRSRHLCLSKKNNSESFKDCSCLALQEIYSFWKLSWVEGFFFVLGGRDSLKMQKQQKVCKNIWPHKLDGSFKFDNRYVFDKNIRQKCFNRDWKNAKLLRKKYIYKTYSNT